MIVNSEKSKTIHRKVDLDVAARNGKATRTITAYIKDREPFVDVINPDKAADREGFVKKLAAASGYPIEDFGHVAQKIIKEVKAADEKAAEEAAAELVKQAAQAAEELAKKAPKSTEDILADTKDDIVADAEAFLHDKNMFDMLVGHFNLLGIIGEVLLATMLYLIGTSRKLKKPLGGCVKSPSASGKSYVTETVASLFPP
jgi:hypothetical protein